MSDDHQIDIPPSFIALFVPPGRLRPTAGRAEILSRYELCEDLAAMLTDTARTMLFNLGITEDDVLDRCERGLTTEGAVVNPTEARWVVRRLAELLDWPWTPPAAGAVVEGS